MSKCTLRIVLEHADRTYKIGEKITGRVEVSLNEDCECKQLAVAPRWGAGGGG